MAESPERPQSRRRWLAKLERFLGHALTQLAVALALIVTSVFEASQTIFEDIADLRLRVAHGLVIVALWQVLKAIPDLFDGIERYIETHRRQGESPKAADGPDIHAPTPPEK